MALKQLKLSLSERANIVAALLAVILTTKHPELNGSLMRLVKKINKTI